MRRAALLLLASAGPLSAGELDPAQKAVAQAAATARPAVVTVVTPNPRDLDQTGVVIDQGGIILTVRRTLLDKSGTLPRQVTVRFPGKDATIRAELIGDHVATDTVVLRAKGARAKPISVARSEDVVHGMWAILVGNTFGQGRESTPTVSLGVISGIVKDRDGVALLHSSTLVNAGSIGAPLVDLSGDLIGIAAPRVTSDGGQSIFVPFARVRAAYVDLGGPVAKHLGRPPPPRRRRLHIADVFGLVVSDTVERAKECLVGVRAGVPSPGEQPQKTGAAPGESGSGRKPSGRRRPGPDPRPVSGNLPARDRSSGLIVGEDGWILCPLRVTGWPRSTRKLTVDFLDGSEAPARIVGTDERLRVALLKIDRTGLPILGYTRRGSVRAGRFAIAIGFPHSAPEWGKPQVTVGVISRTGALKSLHAGFEAYQTDAGVNGGNRGGLLVDLDGRLLGMLLDVNDTEQVGYFTRRRARYGANSGLGFALPGFVIEKLLPRLKRGARLESAFLGVSGVPTKQGLLIQNVVQKNQAGDPTTAARAGLKVGDILVSIGGLPTRTIEELRRALARWGAGERVRIVFSRVGAAHEVEAVLARR